VITPAVIHGAEFIHAHPHDIAAVSATLDVDAAAADPDYFC
jgi:hypothetical protein